MPYALRPKRLHSPRLKIWIERRHIEEAIQSDSSSCMIAEAIRDAYPTAQRISVDLQSIRLTLPERKLRFLYWTPHVAQQAIVDFDQGHRNRLKPFVLEPGKAFQIVTIKPNGSHVTKIRAKFKRGEKLTEEELDILERDRARHRHPQIQEEGGRRNPTAIGGRTPHLVLIARRRKFGVKALRP